VKGLPTNGGVKKRYPLQSRYFTARPIDSSNVQTIADRQRLAAYHNKWHCWRSSGRRKSDFPEWLHSHTPHRRYGDAVISNAAVSADILYGNSAHMGDGCRQQLCIYKKFELMLTTGVKAYPPPSMLCCIYNTSAVRGQYLALCKAWQSIMPSWVYCLVNTCTL